MTLVVGVRGELEDCARSVYELHRGQPAWDALPDPTRRALIAAYWRTRASYEVGRREVREVRIDEPEPAPRRA